MKTLRFLGVLLVLAPGVLAQTPPRLAYRVQVKDGDLAGFRHALAIDRPQTDEVRLSVAAWAPGSYRLMNAFGGIKDVAAVDEKGASREIRRDGDLTWIVASKGAQHLTVTWRFDAAGRAMNNRTYLNETGALLDGPRNYLYWRDRKDLPAHVHFDVPKDWKIACGLTPTIDPRVFIANDVDWLLDCPVLMGKIELWPFMVGDVPHRVAFDNRGRPVEFDHEQFVDCCRRIVEATVDIWGDIPYPHYTFIYSSGGGGGLEHLTSTTIGANARGLAQNPFGAQGVTAHEFFHTWNVKRLRPKALGPFDYDGPVRTKSLWISEGITNYYTHVILARAGLIDEAGFLSGFERVITEFVSNPGYRKISPEEASWTVWDGPYMGAPVSYYTQGEVLGLLMDLEIRGRTNNFRSLDDGMRLLYERFSGARGFQSEDVVSTIAEATGVDLHEFFLRHVSHASEIDWQRYLTHMGCIGRVVRRPRVAINLEAVAGEGGVGVKVPEDSALFRLGLRSGDVVTAVNGTETPTARKLLELLRAAEVGVPIEVSAKRGGETVALKGTIDAVTDVAELSIRRGGPDACTVGRLPDDSPLALAGLRSGDVVKGLNGAEVKSRDEFRALAARIKDGDGVKIAVERGQEKLVIEHRAAQSVLSTFELKPDPAATPRQLAVRRALVSPARAGASSATEAVPAAESRPARKAG
jgi:predicted metalloprotease with PDZ domain